VIPVDGLPTLIAVRLTFGRTILNAPSGVERIPMPWFLIGSLCLVWLSVMSVPAVAQDQITISGSISDTSGGVVSGATVEAIVNGQLRVATTSGPAGSYSLTLPVGTGYQLRVSLDGFASETLAPAVADAATTTDVVLRVGALNDVIVVTASGTERSLANVAE